jgi:hypothetical protein
MNGDYDEVEGRTEEAAEASGDDCRPLRERKAVQAPGRSAGKVKQMIDDTFNDDEFNEDDE